ncbi:MAG TPA: hypothetical protein ACFYEK_05990 [Candidatus Wunengus sp. YC60]|uniref:hypothetical protein n=1 Tax=Candidatus Wunengus sp. YC60 TaxID=3367697 RepID=UPI00402811A0
MSRDYKTICDKCGRKTWYETEQQCHCEYPKTKICKTCGHSERLETMERCTGTLKVIDNSNLNPDFTRYYENGKRIEVDFGYEKKRGTIGKTTGWKPSYLLMLTKRSTGSSYLISKDNKVVKVIN